MSSRWIGPVHEIHQFSTTFAHAMAMGLFMRNHWFPFEVLPESGATGFGLRQHSGLGATTGAAAHSHKEFGRENHHNDVIFILNSNSNWTKNQLMIHAYIGSAAAGWISQGWGRWNPRGQFSVLIPQIASRIKPNAHLPKEIGVRFPLLYGQVIAGGIHIHFGRWSMHLQPQLAFVLWFNMVLAESSFLKDEWFSSYGWFLQHLHRKLMFHWCAICRCSDWAAWTTFGKTKIYIPQSLTDFACAHWSKSAWVSRHTEEACMRYAP